MRTVIIRSILFAGVAYLMTGCTTLRTATFPNKSYDFVFKSTVKGMCTQSDLIVYEADKAQGNINVMTRGVFGGQIISVKVESPGSTSPKLTAFVAGVSPVPDRIIAAVTQEVMMGKPGKGDKTTKRAKAADFEETSAGDSKPAEPAVKTPEQPQKGEEPAPTEVKKRGSLF